MNILNILDMAISLEEDGADFYKSIFKSCKDPCRKQIFYALMIEEQDHFNTFQEIKKSLKTKNEHIIDLEYINKNKVLPDEKKLRNLNTFDDIINQAVNQEYDSIKLYFYIFNLFKDKESKKIINDIIKEEESHVLKLKEMIYYKKTDINIEDHTNFINALFNNMEDLVQVIDDNNNIVFANHAMNQKFGRYVIGKKYYDIFDYKNMYNINSDTKQTIEKDGNYYSVISSPIKGKDKSSNLYIEVFRDITKEKKWRRKYLNRTKNLIKN